MKRTIFFFIVILLCCQAASAYDFSAVAPSGQTLYYNIVNGDAQVTSQNSSSPYYSGSLTIPSSVTYNGTTYAVTSLDIAAFYGCSGLTSVTIPSSVTLIDQNAFKNCTGISSITIPNSVTSIGSTAFGGCTGLTSVMFNADSCVSAGNFNSPIFGGCINLTNITFGQNVKVLPKYLCKGSSSLTSVVFNAESCTNIAMEHNNFANVLPFAGCTNIVSFIFGSTVKDIPAGLCYQMHSLTSVTIPNSVRTIGRLAFYQCPNLTTVTVGTGITSIGAAAFGDCNNLTSVEFNAIHCYNANVSASGSGNPAFFLCYNINNFTFGNNVKIIPAFLCRDLSDLTTITIPDSVISIGNMAFHSCTNLDTVYMMPTVPPTITSGAFNNNASSRVFILNGCSYDRYYTTDPNNCWYNYRNNLVEPIINLNVTVSSSDTTCGSAIIVLGPNNRVVRCDSTAVISATANNGYHFDHWSNGNTTNPDTIALVGDSTVIAYFAPSSYAITGVSCDNVRGTVTGSDTVGYLDTVTLIAHPNYGYHLDHWTYTNENNNNISTRQGGDTLILVATGDRTATAYFAPNQYLLTVNTENPSYGDVYGGGMYDYLSIRTISAVARSGYRFDHWSTGSIDNPYTLTVICDTTITAYFVSNGGTEGIGEIGEDDIRISVSDGRIHVEGITNEEVRVYDITGRLVQNHSLQPGVYMVKIGTLPPQKVVVMR